MKKFIIPVVAVLIAFAGFGCAKKTENTAMDSLKPPAGLPRILFTTSTTIIMPAAADNSSNMTLTMAPAGNNAIVSCYFKQGGSTSQTVTVTYSVGGVNHTATFLPNPTQFNGWFSATVPNSATNVVIAAGGVNYTHTESSPVPAGGGANSFGIDVTKYWDDAPATDVAYVVVQDAAVTTP